MTKHQVQSRRSVRCRGSVYIAVLGVSLIAVTLAVAGIYSSRIRARSADAGADASEASSCAVSGLELARAWMNQDPNWRTTRTSGAWVSGLQIGSGTVSINVVDPLDNDLSNRPHDSVVVTVTAQKGHARRILQQTLTARPTALQVLQYPLHDGADFRLRSSDRLIVGNATASCSGTFRTDSGSTVEGNVQTVSTSTAGIIYGTVTTGVTPKPMPDGATIAESYAKLGTLINAPSTIDKQVLGPGYNPWGAPNPEGVYVIRTSSDLTIRNTRISGTLVVIAPGRTITLDTAVFFQPTRADYPALIIVGDAFLQFSSSSSLSESALATNFNPAGAPYQGVSNGNTIDTYPNEIRGLVDITGIVQVTQPSTIRGCLICESRNSSNGIDVNSPSWQIVYTSSLLANPPQFYARSVQMFPLAGSLKQIVN